MRSLPVMDEAAPPARDAAASARPASLRRAAWLLLALAISAAAIVRLLDGINFGDTQSAFRDADYVWLVPAVLFLVVDLQLRAVRWRLLLDADHHVSHNNLFGASNVGYLVNNVLPFRAGEIARVFLIDELEKTGKIRAAASAVVERVLDVLAMMVLLIALFPFIDEPGWATGPALILGVCVIIGFIVLLALSHMNDAGRSFWSAPVRRVPRVGAMLADVADTVLRALAPLRRSATLAIVAALTAVIWGFAAMSFYMVLTAFHLDGGITAAALVLTATTLIMVVPSAPGYVGVFHAAAVPALVDVFGIPREQALTYAVAQHGVIYIVTTALGAGFLLSHPGLWRQVIRSLRPEQRSAASPVPAPVASAVRSAHE